MNQTKIFKNILTIRNLLLFQLLFHIDEVKYSTTFQAEPKTFKNKNHINYVAQNPNLLYIHHLKCTNSNELYYSGVNHAVQVSIFNNKSYN